MTKPANTPPHASRPRHAPPKPAKDPKRLKQRSLWDIAHPLEVAHSILIFYADPMRELRRRERFARRQKNPEANIRFWAEVEACIRRGIPHPGRTP